MTVLVVGGTGMLGQQVVERLIASGKRVRALVRPTSQTDALRSAGVELAVGDLMQRDSLGPALEEVDAVITTAAGYTGHTPGDTIETDYAGNANLADAAADAGVRRFVFTSILTCEQTPQVPHFWAKKIMEDHLADRNVPFVALRPGAFLDQVGVWGGGNGWADGKVSWVGDIDVLLTFVYTADLAGYLAAAVDAPVSVGERIDIGWDRPVSFRELARTGSKLLGRDVEAVAVDPAWLRQPDQSEEPNRDFTALVDHFNSGRYVADIRRQSEVFGRAPTAEDALSRRLAAMGQSPARA
jgi:uncharacterized protein YbjT (DUF2867 family)